MSCPTKQATQQTHHKGDDCVIRIPQFVQRRQHLRSESRKKKREKNALRWSLPLAPAATGIFKPNHLRHVVQPYNATNPSNIPVHVAHSGVVAATPKRSNAVVHRHRRAKLVVRSYGHPHQRRKSAEQGDSQQSPNPRLVRFIQHSLTQVARLFIGVATIDPCNLRSLCRSWKSV